MMKKTIVFLMCAVFAAIFFCPLAFAETKRDIKSLLPPDAAVVAGVDVYGLTTSEVYGMLK